MNNGARSLLRKLKMWYWVVMRIFQGKYCRFGLFSCFSKPLKASILMSKERNDQGTIGKTCTVSFAFPSLTALLETCALLSPIHEEKRGTRPWDKIHHDILGVFMAAMIINNEGDKLLLGFFTTYNWNHETVKDIRMKVFEVNKR